MFYFKVKIEKDGFSVPAGCVLIQAFQVGEDMWCRFEKVSEIVPDWEKITAEEFEANVPDPCDPVEGE